MNKIIYILFILLFLLQGSKDFNLLVLTVFTLLLTLVFLTKRQKVEFPQYYILALFIYLFYLVLGIINNHENPLLDIKFQLFAFTFYFCVLNLNIDWIKLLFRINLLVFIVYLLLFFNVLPNIWHETTFGIAGRIHGPSVITINLLLFFYLLNKKPFDRKLVYASLLGVVCIALTTNFMNLAIFAILSFLLVVNLKKLLRPRYIFTLIFAIVSIVLFLNSEFVPDLISKKMKYIFTPWQYGSFKTRIDDLRQVVSTENFGLLEHLFGEGFGTSSEVYRYNSIAVSLSKTFSFQEIDNGFYYLYHRGGLSLIFIFIVSHIFLTLKINNDKAKIGYFGIVFITCLLSIHYFNYYFYLLLAYFIFKLNQPKSL